jgi:hypothetical protein
LPIFVGLKVIGKALMLDEIINYVQSLQRQVEVRAQLLELPLMPWDAGFKILINSTVPRLQFLSMKLATVNPLDFSNLPTLLQKDVSLTVFL